MPDEIRVISSAILYESPWLRVREDRILRGGVEGTYSIVERSDSVIVIPLSFGHRTVLLRQFRYPTGAFSWELPMGGIDGVESPSDAAQRELLEETGLIPNRLEPIGEYRAVPGLTPQRVYVFIARMDDAAMKVANSRVDDIHESKIVYIEDVYDMVQRGEITDGFTLAGLLFLRLAIQLRFE